MEKDTDLLLSTLSAMQEKAQHLECNLSAETRIKLDLFSALGDTRRQLEIAQGSSLAALDSVISFMPERNQSDPTLAAHCYLAAKPRGKQALTGVPQ